MNNLLTCRIIGQGQASYFDNVQYNVHHYGTINHYSFGIRYRGLRNGEQLDVSRLNGNDWCGTYVATIARNSGSKSIPYSLQFHVSDLFFF